jgi:hypothetical protein
MLQVVSRFYEKSSLFFLTQKMAGARRCSVHQKAVTFYFLFTPVDQQQKSCSGEWNVKMWHTGI